MPLAIAAPTTDFEIIQMACALVGKQQSNTVASGGALFKDAQMFYAALVSAELGSNRWRFALKDQEMSTLTTLEPHFEGWLYYWTMPADLLMLLRVTPRFEYTVFGDRILTKSNQSMKAIYTRNVPVTEWQPAFCLYMAYKLAGMLVPSVTNSDRMALRLQRDTDLWQSRALYADGQNSPTRIIRSVPWINARYAYYGCTGVGGGR